MAESYRALRTSLLLSNLGAPPKVIMVTSALPQEGKTTTSINCAVVLAQKGIRVLLIDADLRRPSIHKTLGMGPRSGLSNVLTGSATLESAITHSPILPNLDRAARGNASAQPRRVARFHKHARRITGAAWPVRSHCGGYSSHAFGDRRRRALSASRCHCASDPLGQTTKQALRRSRDILMQVNAKVSGVLLNAVDLSSPDYYYYYEYQGKYAGYYHDHSSHDDEDGDGDIEDTVEASPNSA